mgnify:CR=1 FL=1
MELVNFNYNAQKNLEQLYPSGAFLTAGHDDDRVGIYWNQLE